MVLEETCSVLDLPLRRKSLMSSWAVTSAFSVTEPLGYNPCITAASVWNITAYFDIQLYLMELLREWNQGFWRNKIRLANILVCWIKRFSISILGVPTGKPDCDNNQYLAQSVGKNNYSLNRFFPLARCNPESLESPEYWSELDFERSYLAIWHSRQIWQGNDIVWYIVTGPAPS